jgi:hypothetical protein
MLIFLICTAQASNYFVPEYYGSFYKDFNATGALSVGFYWSNNVHISSTLDLWISSSSANTIMNVKASSFSAPKATIYLIAGNKGSAGYRDGDLSSSLLNSPSSLYFYQDKVYVADTLNHCIRVIDLTVKSILQFAGSCTFPGFKDGPPKYNRLNKPNLVGVVNDTLFINDSGNNYVRMVDLVSGNMTTLWGGACRDALNITGEFARPEYNITESVFYSNSGTFHTIVCDMSLVKTYGEPSEEFFSSDEIVTPCSLHITLCGKRTQPLVARQYS